MFPDENARYAVMLDASSDILETILALRPAKKSNRVANFIVHRSFLFKPGSKSNDPCRPNARYAVMLDASGGMLTIVLELDLA